jgi:hypothetical protein
LTCDLVAIGIELQEGSVLPDNPEAGTLASFHATHRVVCNDLPAAGGIGQIPRPGLLLCR